MNEQETRALYKSLQMDRYTTPITLDLLEKIVSFFEYDAATLEMFEEGANIRNIREDLRDEFRPERLRDLFPHGILRLGTRRH